MKYYAVIDKKRNVISSWYGLGDGVQLSLSENEEWHEITKEQADLIGDKEALFTIENGVLVVGELSVKGTISAPPTTEERIKSLEETVNFLLGL